MSPNNKDEVCTLKLIENENTVTSTFSYLASLTPSITGVNKLRGGTGGGTLLTITGSGFPTDQSIVQVLIAKTECTITSLSSTEIKCETGSYPYSSIKAPIDVYVKDIGKALNVNLIYLMIKI